jgi:hypothetical protein
MLKKATTLNATKQLLRLIRQQGIGYSRNPLLAAKKILGNKAYVYNTENNLRQLRSIRKPSQVTDDIWDSYDLHPIEAGVSLAKNKKPFIFVGKKTSSPRAKLFHEYGHALMGLEDPRFFKKRVGGAAHPRHVARATLLEERLASKGGEKKLIDMGVPSEHIKKYQNALENNFNNYRQMHPEARDTNPELYKKIDWQHRVKTANASQENTLKQIIFGNSYIPTPEPGQGAYDAFLEKGRNATKRRLQADAFSSNPVFQRMGISNSPVLKNLSYAVHPESKINKALSYASGGNNMKAVGDLYEGMRGSAMGNFGRIGDITEEGAKSIMSGIGKHFYKHAKEKLVGGAADNKSDNKYPKKELAKGVSHEQEHTTSKSTAKEIAKDHLEEDSDYYSTLDKYKIGCLHSAFEFLK